jgi:hypothetical protein
MALPNAIVTITGDVINVRADSNPNNRANMRAVVVRPGPQSYESGLLSAAVMMATGADFVGLMRAAGQWNAYIIECSAAGVRLANGPYTPFLFAAPAVPDPPTGCNAVPAFVTPGDASNNVKCLVSWVAPTAGGAVDSYTVSRNGVVVATGLTGLGYVDLAVTNNQACVYAVVAVNSVGSSAASNAGSAKTPTVPPTALACVCVGAVFNLSWTAPTGAVAYNVSRAAGSLAGFAVIAASSGGVTYVDGGLAAGTIFYYRCTALNTQAGFNTIESKPGNADAALWLAAPSVLAHWGTERNDNTKPRSRHLRIIDISAAAPNGGVGYVNPIGIAGTVCPAEGAAAAPIGSDAMTAPPAAPSVRLTERPLTPGAGRVDYFTMTAGNLFAYFQVTIGTPVGLPAKVITSACAPFVVPVYITGRRTYYDPATATLVNERSLTRGAAGTIWQNIQNTRRDWLTVAGRLYRDLPKRRGHS